MYKNFFVVLCALPMTLMAASSMNELTKVFHHQGPLGDKLVCYFVSEPICNRVPTKNNTTRTVEETLQFFMPMTLESSEARTMIKKAQAIKHHSYSFTFQEVDKPLKGIKLTISYDPKKVVCNYEAFDAINAHKGLVFSFHNKEILQQLKNKTDGLLQYALQSPKKKTIIWLDFGHGGSDDGKVGCLNTKEKDINLEVGNKVAHLLAHKGYEIYCTRKSDRFVALDERTKYANQHHADLFLSIHANAAQKSEVQGVETYWMNNSLFKQGMTLADSQMCSVLNSLKQEQSKQSESLACLVHEHVIKTTKKMHKIVDRKVKQSVAQVLLGTEMPSALIEIGFLSNLEETKLLIDRTYQELIARGIAAGIIAYVTMHNNA